MAKKRPTLDEILEQTRIHGPKVLTDLGIHLGVEDATILASTLQDEGLNIEAYDFPGTIGVWNSLNEQGVLHKHKATKSLLTHLANQEGVDPTTYEGFKTILRNLTVETFRKHPINRWGTTLGGMLHSTCQNSPSNAVLDLIRKDSAFSNIQDLQSYDFRPAPMGIWKDNIVARRATKTLINTLADHHNQNPTTYEGFKTILPRLTAHTFNKQAINRWGTTLSGMLSQAYNSSPSAAVLDLIKNDSDFSNIQDLQAYDFPQAPNGTWKDKAVARRATKTLINTLADHHNQNPTTYEGFKTLLPHLTTDTFNKQAINRWGTTLSGMLSRAYNSSPSEAVLDLIRNDPDFSNFRDVQPNDFQQATKGTWQDKTIVRHATKTLLNALAQSHNLNPTTYAGFKKLLPHFTLETFCNHPINRWGTTLRGMLFRAYKGSPSAAVLDFIKYDSDFNDLQDLQPYDFPVAPMGTWNNLSMARHATKTLINAIGDKLGVNPATSEGFKIILPHLTQDAFKYLPINRWDTTLRSMLTNTYNGSPSSAVLDLIRNDPDFRYIQDLQPYDFPQAPNNMWKNKTVVRHATKTLLNIISDELGVNSGTYEGFKTLLPHLTTDTFNKQQINRWGTTLGGMLCCAYNSSPSDAVLDLIRNDPDFSNFRDLQPYDFPHVRRGTWQDGTLIRQAFKTLLNALAKQHNLENTTYEGLKTLLPHLTQETIYHYVINRWGTTLENMLSNAYNGSPSQAMLDLIRNDPDFRRIKGRFHEEVFGGLGATRKERAEGRYSSLVLRKTLHEGGLNLSQYGFYSFSKGEKSTVRDLLAEEAQAQFGDSPVAYFGLEGPTFGSYFALANAVQIDAKRSLVAERQERAYEVMQRIKRLRSVNKILNGSSLHSLELVLASAEDALRQTNKSFDLIFLDWLGHLAPANVRELELAYDHLNPNGIIAVTLNMNGISEHRFRSQMGIESNQDRYLNEWANSKQLDVSVAEYIGGDKKKTPMNLYILKHQ